MRSFPHLAFVALTFVACSEPNPLYNTTLTSSGAVAETTEEPNAADSDADPTTTTTAGSGDGSQGDDDSTTAGGPGENGTSSGAPLDPTGGESTGSPPVTCDGPTGALCHEPVTYPISTRASTVDVADQDGDGDIDIAVASEEDDIVLLLDNDGGGLFADSAPVEIHGARPMGVCFADLDGRLPLEVLTADRDGQSISVLSDGGSGLELAQTLETGRRTEDCAVGDIEGDGDQDIVAALRDGHELAVLLNDGSGVFGPSTPVPTLDQPETLWASNVNTATFSGFAVGVSHRGGTGVSVHLGQKAGGLSTNEFELEDAHYGVRLADIDLDGTLDLVSTRPPRNDLVVYWDILDAGEEPTPTAEDLGDTPGHIAVGDFNADETPDIVAVIEDSSRIAILSGIGSQSFAVTSVALEGPATDVAVADLNGDGIDDIALALPSRNEVVLMLSHAGD